jgi:hypothetical protein
MPFLRGGRPLKRWTWIGAFGPELMLCAARARIAGVPVAWWAIWDRAAGRLLQGERGVTVTPAAAVVAGRLSLAIEGGTPVEVVSPHGAQYIWTRKRGNVLVRGHVLGRAVELRGLLDETAGYHARRTAWRWSAGVGELESGAPVAWNLVAGVHDGPEVSERTVWVGDDPEPLPPPVFDGLSAVGGLRFSAEATRAHRQNRLLLRSDYEQPFGTFTGELDGAGALREGWGVMERHDVVW